MIIYMYIYSNVFIKNETREYQATTNAKLIEYKSKIIYENTNIMNGLASIIFINQNNLLSIKQLIPNHYNQAYVNIYIDLFIKTIINEILNDYSSKPIKKCCENDFQQYICIISYLFTHQCFIIYINGTATNSAEIYSMKDVIVQSNGEIYIINLIYSCFELI